MDQELMANVMGQIVFGVLMIIPIWKIYSRVGKQPLLSLLVFIPYIGFLIVGLILAFSYWPKIDGNKGGK